MGDAVAEAWALATDFTIGSHGRTPNYQLVKINWSQLGPVGPGWSELPASGQSERLPD